VRGRIVSVIPGDFDGNGAVDIGVVIEKSSNENPVAKIIWSNGFVFFLPILKIYFSIIYFLKYTQ
jgi:hypothetical protein